jgi:transcriptional regulator GlxA family with amidase domain
MGHIWLQKQNGRHHHNGGRVNGELEAMGVNGVVQHANGHRRRIGFLGFDGVRTLDLAGPLEAFTATANLNSDNPHEPAYQVVLIGLKRKNFVSESGLIFRAQETTETAAALDTIVIPGGAGLNRAETLAELSAWLSQHGPQARRVAAVCGGIYPLAQSGLLDHRSVTTHWRFAHDVARRFPAVQVNTNVSFLKDGPFYTCGGGAAGIEMALSLIHEDQGPETALALARELVVRLRPPGEGETQPDPSIYQSGPSDKIAELPAWIVAHLGGDLSVQALAQRACVCPRHFRRLFRSAFKRSPAEFVEQLRLREAGRRLQTSRHSIDSIASEVGYASADVFRRAFERRLGLSPREYRRRALVPQS